MQSKRIKSLLVNTKHRTANVNEYSARYSELRTDFYVPPLERINPQGGVSNQSSDESTVMEGANKIRLEMDAMQTGGFEDYKELLKKGLSRELSRVVTPMGTYTEWYWKIDLHNLLHFLKLRMDSHAQWEIRQYANAIAEIVKDWVPHVWEAFEDFVLNAVTFSGPEIKELRRLLLHKTKLDTGMINRYDPSVPLESAESGLSKGEMREFAEKLEKATYISYQLWTDYKPEK